jgi:hypothetical protein
MHHLLLVTIAMSQGTSSEDARCRVHSRLVDDASFCGEGGRFGCPLADWFVIGGRWSGFLREALLGQPYKDALAQDFPQFTNGFFYSRLVDEHKAGLDKLWHRFGGSGNHPLLRSGYDHFGNDDDAMPVDRFLYDRFLKPHAGTATNAGGAEPTDFADLDGDEVDESFIGRKWIVVVDYHN